MAERLTEERIDGIEPYLYHAGGEVPKHVAETLFAELRAARADLAEQKAVNVALATRCREQSDLLSRASDRSQSTGWLKAVEEMRAQCPGPVEGEADA